MDVQEKKAFEIAFDNKLGARGCQFDLDEDGNYEDRETLCGWHMWLEAKAQAVPEVISIGNELQSWVAVNSFGAEDVVGDLVIIDANELAEVIEKLTGANA
jgi:hypothetical protein